MSSEALGKANPNFSPPEDILRRHRPIEPSMGAYDINLAIIRITFMTLIRFAIH